LRPVNFFYKPEYDDGSHLLQYGLIAEEVAKVYPEMVAYDHDGQILTVKYQLLAPMLLNEIQKQAAHIHSLEERLAALEALFGKLPATAAAGQ
jgi:Glu-tRNA(Gln) amidotransferase subunit E-like FAD-binding protein